MRALVKAFVGVIAFGFVVIIGTYIFFARDLPDIHSLEDYRPPVISEVFARDGTKIGEFWTECRMFVPYEAIPQKLVQAFIDAEDNRFFEHRGVDVRAIIRAFIANIKAGEITQGGSTITQQVTRSLLLTRERTITRKVKEAILATRLERRLSKEQILTLYLNQIFLGNRAYGVAAAARNYFKKTLSELTLAEMALIAGLPTAPTGYSPINNPQAARERQAHVLQRMFENEHITEQEMLKALHESFSISVAGVDKDFNDPTAAYFTEHVRRIIKERYGDEALYYAGLKIYTTLDPVVTRAAYDAIHKGVLTIDRRQGWRGPIEHIDEATIAKRREIMETTMREKESGNTIAWPPENHTTVIPKPLMLSEGKLYEAVVTGFEEKNIVISIGKIPGTIPHAGYKWARQFNTNMVGYDDANYISNPHAIVKIGDIIHVSKRGDGMFDLAQEAKIQAALYAIDHTTGEMLTLIGGTDFKKSEFNRATQSLRQPGSAFKPFVYAAALDKGYSPGTTILDEPVSYQVGDHEYWSPKNYGEEYRGETTFRQALMLSRNVPTVKIAFDIGTHYLTAFVRKLGITSPMDKYLSMALGSNGMYLSELVHAYATFANGGRLLPGVAITRVLDAKGNILEERTAPLAPPSLFIENPVEAKKEWGQQLAQLAEAMRAVDPDDLNTALFSQEERTLKTDALVLTDLEIKTLYGATIPEGHVITAQTSYLMTELLKSVVEGGTGQKLRELGRPVAGKTGTTNDETDAWFIGFTPDMAAGTWIGFDEVHPIGRKETGGRTAAPIFLDFLQAASKDRDIKDFEPPLGFPVGNITSLSGGSALFGAMPRLDLPGERGGTDRAGEFFEEDLELTSEGY